MKLSKKVKFARMLIDLSQEDLAQRAGVSVSTVVRIEGEKGRLPRQRTLRALADALGVDTDWLTDETRGLVEVGPAGSPVGGGERGAASGLQRGERGPRLNGGGRVVSDVPGLLRRAIRAIEGSGAPRPRGAGRLGALGGRQPVTLGTDAGALRMAPVFDIGADFDRDWSDGDFPTGHGQDERPAFNGDPSGFWCVVHGTSMEPDLFESDLLYFSPEHTTPRDGDICLVRTHEFATVKRVFRIDEETVRLAASNPRIPDQVVNLREDVVQLHRVLCFVRMLP